MKNTVLKKILILLIFLTILAISTQIYASNFNVDLKVDNTNKNKNTIILVMSLKNVNFENIISTIEGNLEYDREIFSSAKIESLNGWAIVLNNEENSNGKIIGFKIGTEEIKQEELCKITLEMNNNVENANTKITLKNIKAADGDNLVATDDKTIDIQIGNGEAVSAKTENKKPDKKTTVKYIFILLIIILLLTISTSVTFLIQKYRLKKQYNQITKKNK